MPPDPNRWEEEDEADEDSNGAPLLAPPSFHPDSNLWMHSGRVL